MSLTPNESIGEEYPWSHGQDGLRSYSDTDIQVREWLQEWAVFFANEEIRL